MKFLGFRRRFLLSFLIIGLAGLAACSQRPGAANPQPIVQHPLTSEVSKFFQPLRINTVYIYPLEAGLSLRDKTTPLDLMQKQLLDAFQSTTSLELVNTGTGAEKVSKLEQGSKKSAKALKMRAIEIGKAVDAQGVLYGVVNRYRHGISSGGGYAAVSFKLWLIEPRSGDVLWSATFEHTEESLSENLLKIKDAMKKGFRFRSVEEISQFGFQEAAKELERLRVSSRGK